MYIYIYIYREREREIIIIPAKIRWLKLSGKSPMGLEIPPLEIKTLLESNPLKSRILLLYGDWPYRSHCSGRCSGRITHRACFSSWDFGTPKPIVRHQPLEKVLVRVPRAKCRQLSGETACLTLLVESDE